MSLFTSKKEREAIERCRLRKIENEQLRAENEKLRADIRHLKSEDVSEDGMTPPVIELEPMGAPKKIIEPYSTISPEKKLQSKQVKIVIPMISFVLLVICIIFIVLSAASAGAFQPPSYVKMVPPTPVSADYTEWGFTVPVDVIGESVIVSNAEIYIDGKYIAEEILFVFRQPAKLTIYGEGYMTRPNGESMHVYQVRATGFSYDYHNYVTVYGITDDGGLKYMQNLANDT